MKKILVIIMLVIGLALIGTGTALQFLGDKEPTDNKPIVEKKSAKTAIVDGDKTNIEETVTAQHIFDNYRFKTIRITETGPFYNFKATVDNIDTIPSPASRLKLTFLANNKEVLGTVELDVAEIPASSSTTVSVLINKESFDAFDFKIERVNIKSLN